MPNKVKYSWQLMHGDGDHYESKSITLENPNDIAFFDYATKVTFESHCCNGFQFDDENDIEEDEDPNDYYLQSKLIELYKQTKMYQYNIKYWPEDKDDEERIMDWIIDTLQEWNYVKGDITCDCMHYASIRCVSKKEIIPDEKPKDSELLKYALQLLKIDKDQLIEKYKANK